MLVTPLLLSVTFCVRPTPLALLVSIFVTVVQVLCLVVVARYWTFFTWEMLTARKEVLEVVALVEDGWYDRKTRVNSSVEHKDTVPDIVLQIAQKQHPQETIDTFMLQSLRNRQ